MSDVFVGEYKPGRRIDAWPPSRYGETIIGLSGSPAQYAAHAINSHDELVAEVKKLRSELADAWFMVDEIKLSLDRRSKQAEYWESIAKE